MDAQRALLDALMGKDRNRAAEEGPSRRMRWDNKDVCQYYICGFCPYQLFVNTRSDLGGCNLIHDDVMADDFMREPLHIQKNVEFRFLCLLERLVDDIDKKIKRGQSRIEQNENVKPDIEEKKKEMERKTLEISSEMDTLLKEKESLINSTQEQEQEDIGNKERINEIDLKVQSLETQKQTLMTEFESEEKRFISDKEKNLKICDICGAFLSVLEAQQRIQSHLEGKQHIGFERIRTTIKELREKHNFGKRERYIDRDKDRPSLVVNSEHKSKSYTNYRDQRGYRDRERRRSRSPRPRSHYHHRNNRSRSRDRGMRR